MPKARRSSYTMAFQIKVIAEAEPIKQLGNRLRSRETKVNMSFVIWNEKGFAKLSEIVFQCMGSEESDWWSEIRCCHDNFKIYHVKKRALQSPNLRSFPLFFTGIAVSGLLLRLKTKQLSDDPSFKASRGWCEKWKRRHLVGMRTKTTLAQRLPAALEENIVQFQRFVITARRHADYPLSCIYNMDETPMRFECSAS